MDINPHTCYQALLARDERYDGRFFTCVISTGIYCRPICPARPPLVSNCLFVPSAAAAQEAGFRPCLRCRPESSPSSAAWSGTSAVVSRALALIDAGELDHGSVESLAERVGLGSRQLRRLFLRHVGAAPVAVAQTRRILLACQLIRQTRLGMAEIALASGFGSVRRFNETFLKLYGRAPGDLRLGLAGTSSQSTISLLLPYRPPYDWASMLNFLRRRAIPGVESADDHSYQRSIRIGSHTGWIRITHAASELALRAEIHCPQLSALPLIIDRLRRLFDLKADPHAIAQVLSQDPRLAPLLQERPGLRLPGCWDPFEMAVKAILGQQISVTAATNLCARLVAQLGEPLENPSSAAGLTYYFPVAERFELAPIQALGMPQARARALVNLAQQTLHEPDLLVRQASLAQSIEKLTKLPGIGNWSAHYIAMRAQQESDAFPASDIGLQRAMAEDGLRPTAKALLARAEAWRPWRAYAVMHLWHADALTTSEGTKRP